ncbi:hypothetical protein GGI35DRAFT_481449 [Trichoderma velutinum]
MPREEQARKWGLGSRFKKLLGRFRSSFRTPSEHLPTPERVANTPLYSSEHSELPKDPPKEEPNSSSAALSQHSPAALPTIDEPPCSEANLALPKPRSQCFQTSVPRSPHKPSTHSPSSTPSPAVSAVIESQSQLASPSVSSSTSPTPLSPKPHSLPETNTVAPAQFSDLWARAFREANDETQEWIRKHGLDSSTDIAQPKNQIEELIGLVEGNKLSEQNEKPLKIEIGNQKIIVREYIADAVAFITMVGDAAITFAPPQASAPWAVAKAVLKIPVKHSEQKAALLGTVQWFARIVRRGQIYEALYDAETTDGKAVEILYDTLIDVYKTALELLASSDTLFDSGIARQTLSAILRPDSATGKVKDLFEKEQWLSMDVQACEASRSTISSKQGNDNLKELKKQLDQLSSPLPRIDQSVASLLEKMEEKQMDELLNFISSEMFGKSHAAVIEARIEHTGDWLLANKEFRAWQEMSSSSTVLCLMGTVGTGKTYLTSKVVDYVKQTLDTSQHDEGFAYFYCNRSGPLMQDPIVVLRSFVRQLACKAFGEPDLIQSSLAQKCKDAKREKRELGYKDCRGLILESLNLYSKTTIILDALDESDITTYNLCIILIEVMEESRKPIKIFISTRPDRKYLNAFRDKRIITLDASNQQEDIERFLEEKLYSTESFIERSPDAQIEIKHVFATRSCGMFRWVYLQVRSLENHITDDAVHNWSRKLPRTLTEAYDQLWENIKGRDEFDVALAERAIMWVLCSFEPLYSTVFSEAIRYAVQGSTVIRKEKQTQQQILSLCEDLLTIDEARNVWMFPHASVAEYFESKGYTNWKCDVFASKVCLGVLENFQPEMIGRDTFANYVEKCWGSHVGRYDKWLGTVEERKADPDLTEALERFLGSPGESSANYRKWVSSSYELRPSNMALLAVCQHGLWYTLRDWWLQGRITTEMALAKTKMGWNSLTLAGMTNCVPICRHLVDLIDVTHPNAQENFFRALENAIREGKFDIVKFFVLEVSLDVNAYFPAQKNSATVAQMATHYHPKILQWILDQGIVDVEKENDSGYQYGSVLIEAAGWGKVESVHMLLKAGANVNAAVHNGNYGSALVAAIHRVSPAIVQLLLEYGADPNLPLSSGKYGSALEASVAHRWQYLEIIRPRGMPDYDGKREEERGKIQHILLEAGADPTAVFEQGEHGSVLAASAFYGRKEILKVMIDYVGTDHAVEILRQSRHPVVTRYFEDAGDVRRWRDTATYLGEVGVSRETLDNIGLWDAEPKDAGEEIGLFLLGYELDYSTAKPLR